MVPEELAHLMRTVPTPADYVERLLNPADRVVRSVHRDDRRSMILVLIAVLVIVAYYIG